MRKRVRKKKKKKREREREREREYLFLKVIMGALAPFSYLALKIVLCEWAIMNCERDGREY